MTDLAIANLPLCEQHMGPCECKDKNTRTHIVITKVCIADVWIEYVQTTRNSCLCD